MEFLPKELEDIIIDYKESLEYQENVENHRKSFNKSLWIIKNLRHIIYQIGDNTINTITIGPLHHRLGYIYCFCFRMCSNCNDFIHSSRMINDIDNSCKCFCQ